MAFGRRVPKARAKAAGSPKKPAGGGKGGKMLTNEALGEIIAKKQFQETKTKIDSYLKANPALAVRVLHCLENDMFAEKTQEDVIPGSTNKFKLISLDHLLTILAGVMDDCKVNEDIKAKISQIRLKSEALKVLCFVAHISDGCALPTRRIPRLISLVSDRAKQLDRAARLVFIQTDNEKRKSMKVDFGACGVYKYSDWCETAKFYSSVVHVDSGVTAPINDDLKVRENWTLEENWNEFAAMAVGKSSHSIYPWFQDEEGEKKGIDGNGFLFPSPLNLTEISERLSKSASSSSSSPAASSTSMVTPQAERRLSRKQSDETNTSPPSGWGGALSMKKPRSQ